MQEKLEGIVINVIKYNDKHNIAHIYTDKLGMLAFLVRQGTTHASRMRNAMFMPLSLIGFEARLQPGRELGTLHDVRRTAVLMSIYSDPMKNAVAMFVSELLSHTIQEQEQNMVLYSYIKSCILRLEESRASIANFHICFLYQLGQFIGIQPDIDSYHEGYWFNMSEGVYTQHPHAGAKMLPPSQAQVLPLLSRMTFDNMHHFKFTREQRNEMLEIILGYYRLHHSTLGTLRSPEVLKQLFV
ncbi:MAG: DNA repair protein RecO [Muribaculaceae bacterium]|nr:DNA repair protein RecO [Muribaculaceae bacterium]